MKMNSKLPFLVFAAMLPDLAAAVAIPTGSAKDGRIQTVMYNPHDVVYIRARIG
ncbi:hypothetical protein [Neisseria iguanae]|uniref:hypothetical protein n=1 Tax=Neisseria iguanae TaxID=90242 RepID=UPI0014732B10|nr:hypothetical protein [Neisseria iguanae]